MYFFNPYSARKNRKKQGMDSKSVMPTDPRKARPYKKSAQPKLRTEKCRASMLRHIFHKPK